MAQRHHRGPCKSFKIMELQLRRRRFFSLVFKIYGCLSLLKQRQVGRPARRTRVRMAGNRHAHGTHPNHRWFWPTCQLTHAAARSLRRRIGGVYQSHEMVSSTAERNHAQTSLNSASFSQPAEAKSWITKTLSPAPLDQQATSSLSWR